MKICEILKNYMSVTDSDLISALDEFKYSIRVGTFIEDKETMRLWLKLFPPATTDIVPDKIPIIVFNDGSGIFVIKTTKAFHINQFDADETVELLKKRLK